MTKKRILSLFLVIVMVTSLVIGILPVNAIEESVDTFAIKKDSEIIDSLYLELNDKFTLYVDSECTGWQVYSAQTDEWVNIVGENSNEITVSWTMFAGLAQDNTAALRCVNGEAATDEVAVVLATNEVNKNVGAINYATATVGGQNAVDNYKITVKYQYADTTKAAEDVVQSFVSGTYIDWDISMYKALGYATLLSCDNESELVCTFSQDREYLNVYAQNGITKDSTIVISYTAGESAYTLKRFFQNIYDDEYSESPEVKSAMTDSFVPTAADIAQVFPGMSLIQYENATVDVRGNTEVGIFYDRDYHLVSFNSMGGINGPESVYARYGYNIGVIVAPTKPGYTFNGWYSDEACTTPASVPSTIGTENIALFAGWTQTSDKANVNVVYWIENADDDDYSYSMSEVKTGVTIGSAYTVTEAQIPEISHEHSIYCYGVTSATTKKISDFANKAMAKLQGGIENGYIYYWDDRGILGDGISYLLRYNGEWYETSSSSVGAQIGAEISDKEGIGYRTDYFRKYQAVMSCNRLYTYNSADTITVGVTDNTVNVYLDRTTFTWKFGDSSSTPNTTYGQITAKWGANVSAQYAAICNGAFGSGKNTGPWSVIGGSSSVFTEILTHMGTVNTNYYKNGTPGSREARYWLQNIDASDTPGATSGNVSPSNYTNKYTSYWGSGSSTTVEDYIEITGFTYYTGPSLGASMPSGGLNFYYKRNTYSLVLNDQYSNVKTYNVQYEKNLSTVEGLATYVPPTPEAVDNHFHFAGWYLNPECSGNKVDLNKYKMPASNMIFYAKWERDIYTVNFYKTNAYTEKLTTKQLVPYGDKIPTVPDDPSVEGMNFVGWFYIDKNGNEMAFDTDKMTVSCNMELYAKWSDTELQSYFVYYKLRDADTEVAAYKTGMALSGRSITVYPKVDAELYIGYQESFFPNVSSYQLNIVKGGENTFTFLYATGTVSYTVNYLDRATGNPIRNPKVVNNYTKITTTEQFAQVAGYLPEMPYRKTVILAYDQENVIDFYYNQSNNVIVTVTYYTVDKDGVPSVYGEPLMEEKAPGVTYSASIKTIKGYTYNEEMSTSEGFIGADGLELELYYDVNYYSYTIKYLDRNNNPIHDSKTVNDVAFGTSITENAETVSGYTVDGTGTVTFNVSDGDNVYTFYYDEESVTFNYSALSGGSVSPTTETVNSISGTPAGSTATPDANYKFVGWYSDEQCQNLVSSDASFTPSKTGSIYVGATYYAKFELATSTLIIENEGMEENETSVFLIKGRGLPNDGLKVMIAGGDSVTITGLLITEEYTVSELNDWAWKYNTNDDQSKVISGTEENKLTFNHTTKGKKAYGAESFVSNLFNLFNLFS